VKREGAATLVADRFVLRGDERAIDLASGEEVALIVAAAGDLSDQKRWLQRCGAWSRLLHPAIARLVDYGVVGQARRFEAWRCGREWRGARVEAQEAVARAAAFLRASALTEGRMSTEAVRSCGSYAVVVPDAEAGYEAPPATASAGAFPLDACGLVVAGRRAVEALVELLSQPGPLDPRTLALWAPRGGGLGTAIDEVARAARLNGYVPLSSELVEPSLLDALAGRSIFLIDRTGLPAARTRLLEITLRSPSSHVLLVAARHELPQVAGLPLERLSASQLARSVRPCGLPALVSQRVVAAAKRSRGLPGQFVSLLWGPRAVASTPAGPLVRTSQPWRAAERSPAYGSDAVAAAARAPTVASPWPVPGDLAALRGQIDAGKRQLSAGRHAPGDRLLRSAIAALARRRDWRHAFRGAMALASSLLRRGRPQEAKVALGEAGEYAAQGGPDDASLDVAILTGVAWMDLARPDAAESVLRALLAAGTSGVTREQVEQARLALARCLFWRGKYDEGASLLASMEPSTEANAVMAATVLSRIAVGRGDPCGAVASATEALNAAERHGDPAVVARAACGAAFAHLAIGDRAASDRDVNRGISAARAARDPLTALRARLLAAESARRAGRVAVATTLLDRIGRLATSRLPPIVSVRCRLLADLVRADSPSEIVRRHVGATGLEALSLFAPATSGHASVEWQAVDDVVEILRSCQTGDDEGAALAAVCSRLRGRLKALAVACFGRDSGGLAPVASEGSARFDSGIGDRVVAAGQTIAPHLWQAVIEGGAPIRYAGEIVGAVVARWPFAAPPDAQRASMLLTMAATAVGPVVAAASARRAATSAAPSDSELLGVSGAMGDVRQAVDRAAAAPFAVLIEGECGSGKELVARALHRRSPRRHRPFCAVNCAALPDDLVEAELFGHARGAFTGAVAERAGVFEEAHTGTLMLDEVGELSPRAQAKLLRTIQEGELRRVGENVARRVDVRIVSATNRDLHADAAASRFRLDLLYRLDVIRISLPPLRARREDIALLVDHYWRDATARVASRAVLSSATIAALARYDWPGNVRELQNVLAALAVRSPKRGVVPPAALPPPIAGSTVEVGWRLAEARRGFEERFVRAALVRSGGHRARAAEDLGVTRQGLTKLMSRLGIRE
jgi:DNA-binding NtrC family response regulator